MKKLTFNSSGNALGADFYPSSAASPAAAVIVTGSWLTVKEQMPSIYAPLLAEAGISALTFDFRGFGASEGGPREVESGRSKAEDILNAAAFLRTLPEVDPDRIGVLAICASASYSALALQGAARETSVIKSVAMVAPWIHDAQIVTQLYGGAKAVRARLGDALQARERYAATGEVRYVKAASNEDASAAMYQPGAALDYYLNPRRGAVAAWGGRFGVMGWTEWLQSDFTALAPKLELPLCIVTGPGTATPGGVEKFVARLPHEPQVMSHTGTQFDFYDQPAQVQFACQHAVAHFKNTLRSEKEPQQ